uniref:Poly(ADP-ribose) glycohydrolase n=1 Tax=Hemiselmis andersenii TaxID=464988 RepID=A0A7S1DQJ5_HEMAN
MHGDPEVKVLVQWMAASECARELDYHLAYEVKERKFIQRLREFVSKMLEMEVTVGQLWDACQDLADYDVKSGSLFESITSLVQGWREQEREMEAEREEQGLGELGVHTPTGSFRGGRSPAASGIIPAKAGGANKRSLRALTLRNLELDGKMQTGTLNQSSLYASVSPQKSAVSPSPSTENVSGANAEVGS